MLGSAVIDNLTSSAAASIERLLGRESGLSAFRPFMMTSPRLPLASRVASGAHSSALARLELCQLSAKIHLSCAYTAVSLLLLLYLRARTVRLRR